MKKFIIIFLCLASICFADKFTSSLKPTTDGSIDIGTSSLLWRKVYADAFTDNFFLVSEGIFSAGTWQADTIGVLYGGTGKSSHTAGGILLGDGVDPITSLDVAVNGQIPIGDGSGAPVLNTITAGAGAGVSNGAGTITISLDPTTLCDAVWCNSTQNFITWTWDLLSDDPILIFRAGEFDFSDDNINTTGLINGVELGTAATDNYWFGDVETMSAGANLVTAVNNIGIGSDALEALTAGDGNIGIGTDALTALNTGLDNVAIGEKAGDSITSGDDNVVIGENAGEQLSTTSNNTMVGSLAGQAATGSGNAFFGAAAGQKVIGSDNVGIGRTTFFNSAADFDRNIAIGPEAMSATVASAGPTVDNIAIGYLVLKTIRDGDSNIGIGASAGTKITNGDDNIAIGANAGDSITTGSDNTVIGHSAGSTFTTQSGNVFLGNLAGQYHALGDRLIIDNQDRTNQAGEITDSLIYGVFNATPASQTLALNAAVSIFSSLTMSGDIVMADNDITGLDALTFTGTSSISEDLTAKITIAPSAAETEVTGLLRASSTVEGSGLITTSGLITGANGETLDIGGTNNNFVFTSAGESNVRVRFVNDNRSEIFASMSAAGAHFEVSKNAAMPVYFYESAADAETPETRFYGFPTGLALTYGSVQVVDIGGANHFQISTEGAVPVSIDRITKIGDGTNQSLFESDGTIVSEGTATVWNDMQFQISDAKVTPASLLPSWEAFTPNTSEYAFSVNDEVDTSANEIPHSWKEGTAGHAHMHITTKAVPAQEQKARFTITFAYADTDEVWVEAPLTAELTIPISTTALTNFYLDLGDIVLTNYLVGAQMRCRVKRVAKSAGGTEYVGDIFITQVGIHFEEDTVGSRAETTK